MSRTVFVANIPFEMTEQQIIDIFKDVGPVVSFKLMFDRETGKPRGYGFCEFVDAETAASAIRNLNGYDVGGRNLIVNTADNDKTDSTASTAPTIATQAQPTFQPSAMAAPLMMPLGATPSFGIEAVNSLLSSLSNHQISDIIKQFKSLANNNPNQATQILQSNPALAYAILQALLNMRLVDPNLVQDLFNQQTSTLSPVAPMPPPQPLPAQVAPPQQQAQTVQQSAVNDEQQRAIIAQIMSLTDEQINALPEQQRLQVLHVREQLSKQMQ